MRGVTPSVTRREPVASLSEATPVRVDAPAAGCVVTEDLRASADRLAAQASFAAARSAARRRKLTIEDVEQELGQLETTEDAKRWLRQIVIWGAGGLLKGVIANACASLVREWLKAHDHQGLETRVRELEARCRTYEREREAGGEITHEEALRRMSDAELLEHYEERVDQFKAHVHRTEVRQGPDERSVP